MSILDKFKDIQLDDSLLWTLKENKFIIKDESIINGNPYLTYNPPKELFLLKEDGSLLNLIFTVYYSYVEITLATSKVTIKSWKTRVLQYVKNWIIDNYNTEKKSVKNKVLYELAKIEQKSKWKKIIKIEWKNYVYIQYLNRSFNYYDIYFQKKDWSKEVKKVKASTEEQVYLLWNYLRKNNPNYHKIDYIYRTDFWKTFWENIFFAPRKRKQFNTKDLLDFTRKLYKIHRSRKDASGIAWIQALVSGSEWNVRATAIALSSIIKSNTVDTLEQLFKMLNKEDLKLWFKETFDPIYLSVIWLADKKWGSLETSYLNLEDIIQRKLFLESSLKKSLKGPLFVLWFLILMWAFTVKWFSKILFDIYDGIWEPRPPITEMMVNVINFFIQSSYPQDLFIRLFGDTWIIPTLLWILTKNIILISLLVYIMIATFKYFIKFSFYWKKAMHNIFLTIPLFWSFIKRSDFEIFLTVWNNLYWKWSATHMESLPLLKSTVRNYHIQWIINTAYLNNVNYQTPPWKVFVLYPDYFPDKVSVLFAWELPDWTEMVALTNAYRNDNDDFIHSLKAIISNWLLFIAWWLLMVIVFATIVPMFQLATKI